MFEPRGGQGAQRALQESARATPHHLGPRVSGEADSKVRSPLCVSSKSVLDSQLQPRPLGDDFHQREGRRRRHQRGRPEQVVQTVRQNQQDPLQEQEGVRAGTDHLQEDHEEDEVSQQVMYNPMSRGNITVISKGGRGEFN